MQAETGYLIQTKRTGHSSRPVLSASYRFSCYYFLYEYSEYKLQFTLLHIALPTCLHTEIVLFVYYRMKLSEMDGLFLSVPDDRSSQGTIQCRKVPRGLSKNVTVYMGARPLSLSFPLFFYDSPLSPEPSIWILSPKTGLTNGVHMDKINIRNHCHKL